MTFQYRSEGAKELTSSFQYYEEKSIGLEGEFLDEMEEAIAQAFSTSPIWFFTYQEKPKDFT